MRQSDLDTEAARLYAVLLTFRWEDQVARYAAFDERVVYSSSDWGGIETTWDAEPAIKVEFSKQQGGASDTPIHVTLPASLNPVAGLVSGNAFAPVDVLIEEIEPGNSETLRPIFFGRITIKTNRI